MCLVETMRKLGENEDSVPTYTTEERSFPWPIITLKDSAE